MHQQPANRRTPVWQNKAIHGNLNDTNAGRAVVLPRALWQKVLTGITAAISMRRPACRTAARFGRTKPTRKRERFQRRHGKLRLPPSHGMNTAAPCRLPLRRSASASLARASGWRGRGRSGSGCPAARCRPRAGRCDRRAGRDLDEDLAGQSPQGNRLEFDRKTPRWRIARHTRKTMRTDQGQPVRLADYQPPNWLVDTVHLDVSLHPTATRVRATLRLRPNPEAPAAAPLAFDGDGLSLQSIKLDGAPLAAESFTATPDKLSIAQPPQRPFTLEIETLVDPTAN